MKIVHISECSSTPQSGMGRIQYNWNLEMAKRGHEVIPIGPIELGPMKHPGIFPFKANSYYKSNNLKPDLILAHEPVSGMFVNKKAPVYLVSHGIESRNWQLSLEGQIPSINAKSIKTRLLFPLWRLHWCDKGIRESYKLLLSNSEDADYVQVKYKRKASDIFIFKNGYYPEILRETKMTSSDIPTIFWNSAWIDRKGKDIFVKALSFLFSKNIKFKVLIAGTGYGPDAVLLDIPEHLHHLVEIVSNFNKEKEKELLAKSDIFVLASYFEGLPLSLVQAMASGLCCIATSNCGQKDIIKHQTNGLLFPTGDYIGLADQLSWAISNIEARKKLGEDASRELKLWTWPKVSKEVVDFILTH